MTDNTKKIAKFDPELAFRIAVACGEPDEDIAQMLQELPAAGVNEHTMTELMCMLNRERPKLYRNLNAASNLVFINDE